MLRNTAKNTGFEYKPDNVYLLTFNLVKAY